MGKFFWVPCIYVTVEIWIIRVFYKIPRHYVKCQFFLVKVKTISHNILKYLKYYINFGLLLYFNYYLLILILLYEVLSFIHFTLTIVATLLQHVVEKKHFEVHKTLLLRQMHSLFWHWVLQTRFQQPLVIARWCQILFILIIFPIPNLVLYIIPWQISRIMIISGWFLAKWFFLTFPTEIKVGSFYYFTKN